MDTSQGTQNSKIPQLVSTRTAVIQSAQQLFEAQQYFSCIEHCLAYLRDLPVAENHAEPSKYEAFKVMVTAMLQDGHDYASAILLLQAARAIEQYAEIFTIHSEKKGVHLSPPKPNKDDAQLILRFCLHLHDIFDTRLGERLSH